MELRCYLPAESRRRRRAPISMPVLVLAVLAVAVLLWQLVYRIAA
jgi:predicted nucleic acid-binding Zn ribbon protein